jgi:hypothetical protein
MPESLLELNLPRRLLGKLGTKHNAAALGSKVSRLLLEMVPVVAETSGFVLRHLSMAQNPDGNGNRFLDTAGIVAMGGGGVGAKEKDQQPPASSNGQQQQRQSDFVSSLLDFLVLVLNASVWWACDGEAGSGTMDRLHHAMSEGAGTGDRGEGESDSDHSSDDDGEDDGEDDEDEDGPSRRHHRYRFDNRHRPPAALRKGGGTKSIKVLEVAAQRAVVPVLTVLLQRTSPAFKATFLAARKTAAMELLETLVTLHPPEWHLHVLMLAQQFLEACPPHCDQFERYGLLHFVQQIHSSVGELKTVLKWTEAAATADAGADGFGIGGVTTLGTTGMNTHIRFASETTTTTINSSTGGGSSVGGVEVGDFVRMKAGVSPCLGYGVVFPESVGVVMATAPLLSEKQQAGNTLPEEGGGGGGHPGLTAVTVSFPEQSVWCGTSEEVEVVHAHARDYIPGIAIGGMNGLLPPSLSKLHFDAAGRLQLRCEVVEAEGLKAGDRVRRGPDWDYDNQDGEEGGLGSVLKTCDAGWVKVEWDGGGSNSYQWNDGGVFDLELVRSEAAPPTSRGGRPSPSCGGSGVGVRGIGSSPATARHSMDFYGSSFAESLEDWTSGCGTLVPVQMIQTSAGWTNAVWGWAEGLNNGADKDVDGDDDSADSSRDVDFGNPFARRAARAPPTVITTAPLRTGPQVASLGKGKTFDRMNALANVVFLSGKHVWEVCIDKDNSAGTCVGATTMPFNIKGAHGYQKENSCWLYRSHRGQLYNKGEMATNTFAPFYESPQMGRTSVVQFYLDLDAGTISITTNGKDQGVAFTNVTAPVLPMVHVYGTGSKSARIQNVFTFSGERAILPIARDPPPTPVSAAGQGGGASTPATSVSVPAGAPALNGITVTASSCDRRFDPKRLLCTLAAGSTPRLPQGWQSNATCHPHWVQLQCQGRWDDLWLYVTNLRNYTPGKIRLLVGRTEDTLVEVSEVDVATPLLANDRGAPGGQWLHIMSFEDAQRALGRHYASCPLIRLEIVENVHGERNSGLAQLRVVQHRGRDAPAASRRPAAPTARFAVGMKIEARYAGMKTWYPGSVSKVGPITPDLCEEGTHHTVYDVQYDDGDFEHNVPARLIRTRVVSTTLGRTGESMAPCLIGATAYGRPDETLAREKGVGTAVSVRVNDGSYLQYRAAVIVRQYTDPAKMEKTGRRNTRQSSSAAAAAAALVVLEPSAYDVVFADGASSKVPAHLVEYVNGTMASDVGPAASTTVEEVTMDSDGGFSDPEPIAASGSSSFFFVGDQVRLKGSECPCGGYGGVPLPSGGADAPRVIGTVVQVLAHSTSGENPPRRKLVWVNFPRHKGFVCLQEELVLHKRGRKSQIITHVFNIDRAITRAIQCTRQSAGKVQSLGQSLMQLFQAEDVLQRVRNGGEGGDSAARAVSRQGQNRAGALQKADILQFSNHTFSEPRVQKHGLVFGDNFPQALECVQQLMRLLRDKEMTLFELCGHSIYYLLHGLLFASNEGQSAQLLKSMMHPELQSTGALATDGAVSSGNSRSTAGGMHVLMQFFYRLFMAEEKLPIFSFKAKGFENLKSLSRPLLITLKPHPASTVCVSPINLLSNKTAGGLADTAGVATSKDGKRTCEGVPKLSKWGSGAGGPSSSPSDCILVVHGLPSVHSSLQAQLEKLLCAMFSDIGKLDAHSSNGAAGGTDTSSSDTDSQKNYKKIKQEFQTLKLSEDDDDLSGSPKNKRPKVDGAAVDGDDGVPVCVPINKHTNMTLTYAYVPFGTTFDAALASQIADGFKFYNVRLRCTRFSSLLQQQLYVNPLMPMERVQQHILRTVQASNQHYANFCMALEGASIKERRRVVQAPGSGSSGRDISRISSSSASATSRANVDGGVGDDGAEHPYRDAVVKQWFANNGAHLLEYANGEQKTVVLSARDYKVVKGTKSNVVAQRSPSQDDDDGDDAAMEGGGAQLERSSVVRSGNPPTGVGDHVAPAWLANGGATILKQFSKVVRRHPCMADPQSSKASKKHGDKSGGPHKSKRDKDGKGPPGGRANKSRNKTQGEDTVVAASSVPTKAERRNEVQNGLDELGTRIFLPSSFLEDSSGGNHKSKSKADRVLGRRGSGAPSFRHHGHARGGSSDDNAKLVATIYDRFPDNTWGVVLDDGEVLDHVKVPLTPSSSMGTAPRVRRAPQGSGGHGQSMDLYSNMTHTISHPSRSFGESFLHRREEVDGAAGVGTGGGDPNSGVGGQRGHPESSVKNSDSALGLTRDWSALSPSQTNPPDHIHGRGTNRRGSAVVPSLRSDGSSSASAAGIANTTLQYFENSPQLHVGLSVHGDQGVHFMENSVDRVTQTRATTVFQYLQLLHNRAESSSSDSATAASASAGATATAGYTLFYDISVDFPEQPKTVGSKVHGQNSLFAGATTTSMHDRGGDDENEACDFFPERLVDCRKWDDKDVLLQIVECDIGRSSALVLQLLAKFNNMDIINSIQGSAAVSGHSTRAAGSSSKKPQICSSLSKKLVQQLDDPMAIVSGALPKWCHSLCTLVPSLFDLKARTQLFLSTAFGVSRAVHWIQQKAEAFVRAKYTAAESAAMMCTDPNKANRLWANVDRIESMRDRVRKNNIGDLQVTIAKIDRTNLLRDTEHIMQKFKRGVKKNGRLEVQFVGDTGFDNNAYEAGVTQGFYSIVAKQLQKRAENKLAPLWADGLLEELPHHDGCVYCAQGVRPLPSTFDPLVLEQLGLVEDQASCSDDDSSDMSMEIDGDGSGNAKDVGSAATAGVGGGTSYPLPFSADQSRQILKRWEMIGHLAAVAMRDQFRFPIQFSLSTLKLLQGCQLSRDTDLPPVGELGGHILGLLPVCKKLDDLDLQLKSGALNPGTKEQQVSAVRHILV